MSSTDLKKQSPSPSPGDCVSSLGPLPPNSWASTETGTEMAAPDWMDPSMYRAWQSRLTRVRMEAWRADSAFEAIGHLGSIAMT